MLHFFPRYSNDVDETPFAQELRRLGVPHKIFACAVSLRYRTLAGLLLGVYPRLVRVACAAAWHSFVRSRPRPDAVIVGNDIEALVFAVLRLLTRSKARIVFETLIVKPPEPPLRGAAYMAYYRLVLSAVDVAICHSETEIRRYRAAFSRTRTRFACVPFGTTVTGRAAMIAAAAGDGGIVTAGRSGRDYRTLVDAIAGLDVPLRIICDRSASVAGITPSAQVTVVRDCFGDAYLDLLANATIVVVPLSVADVSAGQMVLLQAAALARPVVITRTATTLEYATDGVDAVLVPMGDVAATRAAIEALLADPAARARLGAAAAARFERDHSTEAYVRNLVTALGISGTQAEAAVARLP